jgi:hypothetical protein
LRDRCGAGLPAIGMFDGSELALDEGTGPPDDELLFRASDVVCREQRTSRRRSRRWSFQLGLDGVRIDLRRRLDVHHRHDGPRELGHAVPLLRLLSLVSTHALQRVEAPAPSRRGRRPPKLLARTS